MIVTRIPGGEGTILVVVLCSGLVGFALCRILNVDPQLPVFGHQSRRFFGCQLLTALLSHLVSYILRDALRSSIVTSLPGTVVYEPPFLARGSKWGTALTAERGLSANF